jgi:hypothetical protein
MILTLSQLSTTSYVKEGIYIARRLGKDPAELSGKLTSALFLVARSTPAAASTSCPSKKWR